MSYHLTCLLLFIQFVIIGSFKQDARTFNRPLPNYEIILKPIGDTHDTAAASYLNEDSTAWIIEFDSTYCKELSINELYTLFYHELGHCYLNRNDTNSISIMNYDYLGVDILDTTDKYFTKELFTN